MSSAPEFAVRLTDVSKSYVAYAKPHYWLADFLGAGRLLREGTHYRSHWALRDVNLEIPKGGKVAFVGRNGAGKSTLLRIISENVTATTGRVEVHGHCEALMQLGAGFNPEFTGRENVLSALAYMGITGRAAEERLWDILDFSELDDFIEQPVRTYSSGMYVRLAFSVATVIAPEILIIDEILGAGDMYFQTKCLARIQEMTSGPGTTVLFVSHDMQAALRICDTFVWLDRGRIVKIGPSAEVRAAYEDSIRKQQEIRLRARNLRLRRRTLSALQTAGEDGVHLLGQLVRDEGGPGPHVDGIGLYVNGARAEEIRVGDAMDDDSGHYHSFVISDPAESAWGPPERRDDRLARPVGSGRDNVNGAKFALFLAHHDFSDPGLSLEIEVSYQDTTTAPSHLELNAGFVGLKRLLTLEHAADGRWKTARLALPTWLYAPPGSAAPASPDAKAAAAPEAPAPEKRFGTGQLLIDRVRFLDEQGAERYVFPTGRRMSVAVRYHVTDPSIVGTSMLWAVGFERADGIMASTMISTVQDRTFPVRPNGELRLVLDPLLLTRGHYRVSVVLFSELDLHGFSPHFTRSPSIYDMHRLAYEVDVEGTYAMEVGLFRAPVQWLSDEDESLAGIGPQGRKRNESSR